MTLKLIALRLLVRRAVVREAVKAALSQPVTDDLRRAVWRAQYELRRSEGGEELQFSDEGIDTLVERRVQSEGQRRQDEAAFAVMMEHLRRQAGVAAR